MHSWRVLILPWLGQQAIYDQYCFEEPWDGPNNRKLHDLVVSSYLCPSHTGSEPKTSYAAIVGPETAWPGARPLRLEEVVDGQAQTILLVEVAEAPVHWMEPSDLIWDRLSFQVNPAQGRFELSSHHPGGANLVLVDGSVRFVRDSIRSETLRGLLTITGRESLNASEF